MEVVKCGLCKEEIKYSQRCRVYIKTVEPRSAQRSSKRPHIGRYKVISTAPSTEHISFARRLKLLRNQQSVCNYKNSTNSSENIESSSIEQICKVSSKEDTRKVVEKSDLPENPEEENTSVQQVLSEEKDILRNSTELESKFKKKHTPKVVENSDLPENPEEENTSVQQVLSEEKDILRNSSELESKFKKKLVPDKSPKKKTSRRIMSHSQFQTSFEGYVKPVSKTPGKVRKTKSSDSNSDLEVNRKGSANTYKPTKNGTRGNRVKEFESYFWLELPKSKIAEPRKLAYQFENLVSEVKHMKLPNTEWKIKIMVHKQEMVSVSFNKKQSPEKSVTVNAKSSVCDISIGTKKLILMGSPIYIYSIKDLEILLDIVNEIDPESPLIQYL